jgi:chromosome segregation ATPase|tara:strand:+ start:226 stop:573 length:348 start_codon:yes stop_codon:yes gene_type:complete
VDILEQLEQKILNTVSALDDARKESMTFRDECSSLREETDKLKEGNNTASSEIETLKQQLAEANQRLEHRDIAIAALQHQYELAKKESIRMTHEKNDWEVKVTALMETIEQSVTA